MYIYIYICYIHVFTDVRVCIHTYICTCVYIHVGTRICTYMCECIYTHVYICIQYVQRHPHAHIPIHDGVPITLHLSVYGGTHLRMYICMFGWLSFRLFVGM